MIKLPTDYNIIPLLGKALLEILPQESLSELVIAPDGYNERKGLLKARVLAIRYDPRKPSYRYKTDTIYVKDVVWFMAAMEDVGEKYIVVKIERIVAREI